MVWDIDPVTLIHITRRDTELTPSRINDARETIQLAVAWYAVKGDPTGTVPMDLSLAHDHLAELLKEIE